MTPTDVLEIKHWEKTLIERASSIADRKAVGLDTYDMERNLSNDIDAMNRHTKDKLDLEAKFKEIIYNKTVK